MFSIFKSRKENGEVLNLKIDGMHCVSCSLNIDSELEDLDGVIKSETSYAKSEARVIFDPKKTSKEKIVSKINEIGYGVII